MAVGPGERRQVAAVDVEADPYARGEIDTKELHPLPRAVQRMAEGGDPPDDPRGRADLRQVTGLPIGQVVDRGEAVKGGLALGDDPNVGVKGVQHDGGIALIAKIKAPLQHDQEQRQSHAGDRAEEPALLMEDDADGRLEQHGYRPSVKSGR